MRLHKSGEEQIPSCIELNIGHHTSDELQENKKSKVRLYLVTSLHHCVRHTFKNSRMTTWMHCRHHNIFKEGEFFHCQSLVEILTLNVFSDIFIGNRLSFICSSTEVHSGSMIVLVIDNVHFIVSEVILVLFFLLRLISFQNDNLIFPFLYQFILKFFWFLLDIFV